MTEYTIFVPLLMSRVEFNASSLLGAGKNGFHDALGLSKKCGARKEQRDGGEEGKTTQVQCDPLTGYLLDGHKRHLGFVYVQHDHYQPSRTSYALGTWRPHLNGAKDQRRQRVTGVNEY